MGLTDLVKDLMANIESNKLIASATGGIILGLAHGGANYIVNRKSGSGSNMIQTIRNVLPVVSGISLTQMSSEITGEINADVVLLTGEAVSYTMVFKINYDIGYWTALRVLNRVYNRSQ